MKTKTVLLVKAGKLTEYAEYTELPKASSMLDVRPKAWENGVSHKCCEFEVSEAILPKWQFELVQNDIGKLLAFETDLKTSLAVESLELLGTN